uniref:hypothetical protein n=1 Tax=Candidatus Planktophila sp. TaxID=2175601 RepID=UPI00404AD66D
MRREVRESGLPVPRQVATSITLPAAIFPNTNFCPSGRSITNGESEGGIGNLESASWSRSSSLLICLLYREAKSTVNIHRAELTQS